EFHFGVEAFRDAVVAGEAPHGRNLRGPVVQRFTEPYQLQQSGLPQLLDRSQEPWHQSWALSPGAVFL
ncbi:MAG TPA: hypothetical protein VN622_14170, partial [Clostridia bacterium]|nr:hypothetical protein [Clostridia bacterium]